MALLYSLWLTSIRASKQQQIFLSLAHLDMPRICPGPQWKRGQCWVVENSCYHEVHWRLDVHYYRHCQQCAWRCIEPGKSHCTKEGGFLVAYSNKNSKTKPPKIVKNPWPAYLALQSISPVHEPVLSRSPFEVPVSPAVCAACPDARREASMPPRNTEFSQTQTYFNFHNNIVFFS